MAEPKSGGSRGRGAPRRYAYEPPAPKEVTPGPPDREGMHRWPADSVQRHMAAVEQLLLTTSSSHAIQRAMRERFQLSKNRVSTLIDRVRGRWLAEDVESRPTYRTAQIRRLEGYIRNAQGVRAEDGRSWATPPNHGALKAYESLLADIQGTKAPVEVSVDVRVGHSIQAVIANMTAEQLTDRLARARERRALAERAEVLLAAVPAEGEEQH